MQEALTQTAPLDHRSVANPALFLKRWLANPLQMGSIVPSSTALCSRVVRQTRWAEDEYVLELGAGTGVISGALLAGGLPPEKLVVVDQLPRNPVGKVLKRELRLQHAGVEAAP